MGTIEEFKKRRRAKDLRKCRHFNGLAILGDDALRKRETCLAGVAFSAVRDGKGEIPCLGEPCRIACSKWQPLTVAELDAKDAAIATRVAEMSKARAAIVEHAGPHHNGYDPTGVIPCPVCGTGKLHYSRSGYNGHIHAGCSTGGCVSWME